MGRALTTGGCGDEARRRRTQEAAQATRERERTVATPPALIVYERHEERVTHDGATAHRGTLRVGALVLHTIERLDGYVWLRPGTYDAVHAVWTSRSGRQAPAVRVLGVYGDRIYVPHAATLPRHLAGCVAAGLRQTATGVGSVPQAMGRLWRALGGYEEGLAVRLEVRGAGGRE